ncbi:MAG: class II aldolase/adducin family protein [Candidatus Thermoplasmatota archaeon]|jgi:ribulose-5-phosphate 4-epimerase/fuculose-1-phosphate aldolase|nr:class II aldolase/adducin family protein [Candidatus Thermoplasmatota archaeon]
MKKNKRTFLLYQDNMIMGKLPNFSFQTFYVSKEKSNCPLIFEIVKTGKKLIELNILKESDQLIVSLRYVKRILINADKSNFKEIKQEDFLEIVDYDPLKKVILLIGPKEPRIETPIHWLIHNSRNEINAVIQINDSELAKKLEKKFASTEKNYPAGTLEQAKEILRILRNSKIVVIKNQGVLFVGKNTKETEELIIKTFEDLK